MKTQCENCRFYEHRPNILGGVAECKKEIKPLNVFWPNEACRLFKSTKKDNLKPQNNFYKKHLKGVIQLKK